MNNNASGRRGFSFLSFILGILIGIILVIGSVAGAAYYVLSGKIDDVMNTVGMPNKDEDGNNIYINTDKENGGVETLLELVTKMGELMSDTGSLSVGKVEKLVPAVSGFVDGIHETLAGFVEIDREEFASVEFSALGEFVQEKVLDIEPAKLLDGFGMGGALDNKIVSLIFNGSEAEYVVDESTGVKYPAYYDVYNLSEGKYLREGDGDVLDQNRERVTLCRKTELIDFITIRRTEKITLPTVILLLPRPRQDLPTARSTFRRRTLNFQATTISTLKTTRLR